MKKQPVRAGLKVPTDQLMTDGCGFINHAALLLIVKKNGYECLPDGIQGRIGSGKGFFILYITDDANVPKIWTRDSQEDQEQVVRSSQPSIGPHRRFTPSASSALTQQSIINLHADSIPAVKCQTGTSPALCGAAISKAGEVPGARTHRVAYSLNRVLGLKC